MARRRSSTRRSIPGNLHLGNAHSFGRLPLAQPLLIAQEQKLLFLRGNAAQDPFHPLAAFLTLQFGIVLAQQIGQPGLAGFVHRRVQRDHFRLALEVDEGDHFLGGNAHFLRQLHGAGGAQMLLLEALLQPDHLVQPLPRIPGSPHHTALVPEIVAQIAGDGGHGVGNEAQVPFRLVALQRFQEPHGRHLFQILPGHAPAGEFGGDGFRQGKQAFKQPVAQAAIRVSAYSRRPCDSCSSFIGATAYSVREPQMLYTPRSSVSRRTSGSSVSSTQRAISPSSASSGPCRLFLRRKSRTEAGLFPRGR